MPGGETLEKRIRRYGRFRLWLLLVIVLLVLFGCSANKKIVLGDGYLIRDVELQGVNRFSKNEFLDYLYAGETKWWPTAPNIPYDDALLAVDKERIIDLYRSFGYYRVKVIGIEARIDHDKQKVDLTIQVDEGEPTRVRNLAFIWSEKAQVDPAERADVERLSLLSVGNPFDTEALNETTGSLRLGLLARGFPLARVSGKADVQESALQADVTLKIDPGPPAVIGQVRFEGLVEVPEYLVEREVRFAYGKPFSPALLNQMDQSVKALQVFRWVTVFPTDRVDDGKIDVVVRVNEADPQSVKFGVQLAVETIRWQEQLTAEYTHTNLFGNLTRLDLKLALGWAEMPNPWDISIHGPVIGLEPRLTKKGLIEDFLIWEWTPGIDIDVQEGYQYYAPRNRFGVSRWFDRRWLLGLSHNFMFYDFFNVSPHLDSSQSVLGRDFRDPFLLSFFEIRGQLFLTDSIIAPTNGFILDLTYDIAGWYIGSDYDFHKIMGGGSGYWHPITRLQFAIRLQTGLILPYGKHPNSPIVRNFYLGGADTVRGWGSRRLSPRLVSCTQVDGCESIPIGGYTMIQGNFETRVKIWGPISMVAFFDMGDVQSKQYTYAPSEWNYSAGPGLRVESPLGLARLDFGYRLNDPGIYPDEKRWGIYFGLGETF